MSVVHRFFHLHTHPSSPGLPYHFSTYRGLYILNHTTQARKVTRRPPLSLRREEKNRMALKGRSSSIFAV